jgi:formylglycine-generating enzyme required for sulfatase activity
MLAVLLALALVQATPEQESTSGRGVGMVGEPVDQLTSTGYRRRHALVVGIDDYAGTGFPSLGYAVADARAVAKILIERYGFEQEHVRLLLDEDATKVGFEAALEDWACDDERVGDEDLFVLFFAGHGETRSGRRGSRGYLAPADGQRGEWSTLLGMDQFEGVSELIPAKHALFILDCCFGGLAVTRSAPPVAAGLTNRARQAISAGTAKQTVQDAGGGGHSVFTGALLDALQGSADLDGDQVVTFGELFNHVGREVERKTEQRQTPLQAAFPDHEGGNVALFPPGVKPGQMTAAERLQGLERTAEEQLAELDRLADALIVLDLVREANELWPPHPAMIPGYRHWMARADELLDRKAQHEASVRQVRQEAYLSQVVAGELEEGEGAEPVWTKVRPKLRWRYETFVELVGRLETLSTGLLHEDTVSLEYGWSIPKRLLFAREMAADFAEGGEQERAWREVLSAIRADHPDLDLKPQLGLVPIGADPESGLWEFAHLMTGAPAQRDVEGRLVLTEETGAVFVLLPRATFWMGAQAFDPQGRNYEARADADEAPVHEVELSAFFLSKYEMTQSQWKRLTGHNPSNYQQDALSPTLLHPVEQVSWLDCMTWLPRAGLTLPSEAQWEYGARAGTTTAWWTGSERESLRTKRAANLADQAAARAKAPWTQIDDWPELDDGYGVHAPAGTYAANAFGLHEVPGNLWEMCLDGFDVSFYAKSPRVNPVAPWDGVPGRVYRGGSFSNAAAITRSANRSSGAPANAVNPLGVRPARAVDP